MQKIARSLDPALFPPAARVYQIPRTLANSRGQGLIEYLVIVALIAVATIGIMRVMGQAVSSRFATITEALEGKKRVHSADQIDETLLRKKDLGDFMNGVAKENGGR